MCAMSLLFLQKWHWFAAFADPLWLIATIEYIALVTRGSQEKSRISSYLWLNDDGLPNLVSKQTVRMDLTKLRKTAVLQPFSLQKGW